MGRQLCWAALGRGPIVQADPLWSYFQALSWVVSRMSLDTFWKLAQPRSRAQMAAGITLHVPKQNAPAGSTLPSISTCFLAVPQGTHLTAADDIALASCWAAPQLSQIFRIKKFTSPVWLECLAQCFEVMDKMHY